MKKLAIVGGNASFVRFMQLAFSGEIICFFNMEEAGKAALREHYEAIIVLAGQEKLVPALSVEGIKVYTSLQKAGQKVYAEMYDAGDYNSAYLFGFMVNTYERAVYNECFIWKEQIMQARCASYLPGRVYGGQVLMKAEDCIGSHSPVIPGKDSFAVLIENGNFLYSAMRFSAFDRFTMLPNVRWKAFFGSIFSKLLGEETKKVEMAFEEVWPAMKLAGKRNTTRDAVIRAVNWHFNSGVMSDMSGMSGCYEMIRSSDLKLRKNQRVDSMLLTAALLCTAGRNLNIYEWENAGKNLADYCIDTGLQITQGANKGIFCWYNKYGLGNDYFYSSDTGRDGMAMLQMYRITKEAKYLESLKILGEAYLRWTDGEPYLKATSFGMNEGDLKDLKRTIPACNSPVFYEGMALVLANLFSITGEERYRTQLKLSAEAMVREYPNYNTNFTPLTKNFVCSRLITILCAAQEIGCGDYSSMINKFLSFFEKLQDQCGGVQDSELIIAKSTYTHDEFAVSMGAEHDRIVDMLYCTNNLLGCFSIIRSMKNPLKINCGLAMRMREKMITFLLNTQIAEGHARLYGGWMRAYDMENREYYGVNKDKVWGAYCIMGGWIMGFFPLLLLEEEGAPSIYSIDR